ncbi:MAG: hypothetical protein GY710_03860 [Desulfobacteraceae bacterium]|nr:hypothetical protein [Desulfobacteraceae bacterium]
MKVETEVGGAWQAGDSGGYREVKGLYLRLSFEFFLYYSPNLELNSQNRKVDNMSLSELILHRLSSLGVVKLFGIPGDYVLP